MIFNVCLASDIGPVSSVENKFIEEEATKFVRFGCHRFAYSRANYLLYFIIFYIISYNLNLSN